jgi:hypothetical protein
MSERYFYQEGAVSWYGDNTKQGGIDKAILSFAFKPHLVQFLCGWYYQYMG